MAEEVPNASELAQRVRSLLSNRCFACHGPDEEERQGGFRLDDAQSFAESADSGLAPIVPGFPERSELLARIMSDDEDLRMPPPDFSAAFNQDEIAIIQAWIKHGARLPQHWSFIPPERPDLPSVSEQADSTNWYRPIDRFVLNRMRAHDFTPSPRADKPTLLRRLSLDLIGLPPTPEEVESFVADLSPNAYERQVDRLLASPRFGEHWAGKWLDLARYADSAGYADDPPRTIWAYRDWVVRALNAGGSLQQFTVDQIAGDLVETPTQEQLIATAFHRNTLTNNEGGTNDEEFRNVAIVDRVNTTMAVWMGITMACAQCHTHKYDPYTQAEYFQLFAIFNQSADADRRNESPTLPVFSPEALAKLERLRALRDDLDRQLNHISPALVKELKDWRARLTQPTWQQLSSPNFESQESFTAEFTEGAQIKVLGEPTGKADFTLEFEIPRSKDPITALRLTTIPVPEFARGGAGLGGGNFVLTHMSASLAPDSETVPQAQVVRIDHPGEAKILSLAEVEVLSQGKNLAPAGRTSQSSTDYNGAAQLAIDGDTNGNYDDKSTTHTRSSTDPWWQVDLGQEFAIDTIRIWNRTDNALQSRLKGAKVSLLNAAGEVVFKWTIQDVADTYKVATEQHRELEFAAAYSDYAQAGFAAKNVLVDNAEGWAVEGAVDQSHDLFLVPKAPLTVSARSRLRVQLRFQSPHARHILGSFRITASATPNLAELLSLPQDLQDAVQGSQALSPENQAKLTRFFARNIAATTKEQRYKLRQTEQQLEKLAPDTSVPIMRELAPEKNRATYVQIRGNYKSLGEQVEAGTPAIFHPPVTDKPIDRLTLANWLVDRQNPLTARVWMNRLWESLFGLGLVRSSEEFGAQGDPPSHPQLLDWLAVEFMDRDWNVKQMLRQIVTSQTYQQTSRVSETLLARDQDNIWLARGPRVRLSAEMVRDQALLAAGLLSTKMHGPPVKPPQPDLGLKAAFGSATDWKPSQGEDRYRRAVYTTWRRSSPYPSMMTFDAPSREVCTLKRDRTNTPLQALVTLNDPGFVEAAQGLARRVVRSDPGIGSDKDRDRIALAFELATSRPATSSELDSMLVLLTTARQEFEQDEEAARLLATDPIGPLPAGVRPVELAALTTVCNVILNLDEVLMKR